MTRARIGALALGLLLVLLLLTLPFLQVEKTGVEGSAASVEPSGRRAAFLLLERLGFDVQAWREKPGLLPAGRHVLWLARAPQADAVAAADRDDADPDATEPAAEPARTVPATDPLEQAREGGPASARHYRGFIEQGGTLIMTLGEAEARFLRERLSLGELGAISLEKGEPVDARGTLAGGVEVELQWEQRWLQEALDPRVPREVLLADASGRILALHVPVGRGGVVLLSSARFASNVYLARGDHALVLVRLLEALARDGSVLFDEHALGLGHQEDVVQLALGPRMRLFTLHLLACLLLLLWRVGWSREFPRDPARLAQLDPAARARAQAAWTMRAGRVDLLARMLRQGVLERLLPAARRAQPPEGAELERELELLAVSAGMGAQHPRWLAAFRDRPVRTASELAELDLELRALEADVHATRARADGGRTLQESRA